MTKYDEKSLVLLDWPRAQRTPDGGWTRVWKIHCKEVIDPHISLHHLSAEYSGEDFVVALDKHGPRDITAQVTTYRRHGGSDAVVFANYDLLKKLNDSLGTIETIQGQARDLWLPWRQ
jgi:hypothetical protein